MVLSRVDKAAAFCRELVDGVLQEAVRRVGAEELFERARLALQRGRVDAAFEADLDTLDRVLRQTNGDGIYPSVGRSFEPWPSGNRDTAAQWWCCPTRQCAGRGRIVAGQQPPVCGVESRPLVVGPFPT